MKNPRTLSFVLSIFLHSLLAILILRAGYKLAFPEGNVSEETVTFETFQTPEGDQTRVKTENQTPESKKSELVKAVRRPKTLPKKGIVALKGKRARLAPAKDYNDVVPAEKNQQEPPDDDQPQAVLTPQELAEQREQEKENEPAAPIPLKEEKIAEKSIRPMTEQEGQEPVQDTGGPEAKPSEQKLAARYGITGPIVDASRLKESGGNKKPDYPWMARLRRQEGTVTILAYIKANGSVDVPIIEKSSGYPVLDQNAVQAYSLWHYVPGPATWARKSFRFRIK